MLPSAPFLHSFVAGSEIPTEPDMGQCKGAKLVRAPGMGDNLICKSTVETTELKSMESSFKFRPSEHREGSSICYMQASIHFRLPSLCDIGGKL
jgi:hypothetical protein